MTGAAEPRNLTSARTLLRVAIVLAVVSALVIVATTTRSGVTWRLITFTYQVNVLAGIFYLGTLFSPRIDRRAALRGAVVVYLVVAGLVWNLFLTGYSMGYTPANFLLHVVVPVLAVLEWLIAARVEDRDHAVIRWWHPLVWLVYPGVYVAVALLVLNHAGRRVPYYFLDPSTVGTVTVAVNIAVLGLIFLALGYLVVAIGRSAARRRMITG